MARGAVAELYGADPEAFTERRKALAAAARDGRRQERGDRDRGAAQAHPRGLGGQPAGPRRPGRARPGWPPGRRAAGRRAGQGRAAAARAVGRPRRADRRAHGPGARRRGRRPTRRRACAAEVTATLTAALADPATAAEFAAGTLTKAAQWSGFGSPISDPADDSPPDGARSPDASDPVPVDIATRRSRADARCPGQTDPGDSLDRPDRATRRLLRTAQSRAAAAVASARRRTQSQRGARRSSRSAARGGGAARGGRAAAAAEEQRLAREAAERAARARKKYEDVERTVVSPSTAAAEAEAAEDRLEAEVRDLEERLTKAREDLAAARRRARHAEAAERRARQTLDRLPRPLRTRGLCRHRFDCLV